MEQQPENDIIIVGGGITGLAIAYIASLSGKRITVVEGSPDFGGLLNTFQIGEGYLERFYHHFFVQDKELDWLLRDLGIRSKLKFSTTNMGTFRDGKNHSFGGALDLLRFPGMGLIAKLRFGLSGYFLGKIADWKKYEHVPTLEWMRKWAGAEATKVIWEPLLKAKFGKYAEDIPVSWMIGRLKQRMHSRKQGEEALGYLEGSLKTLLDALLARLKENGVNLISGAPIDELIHEDGRITGVKAGDQSLYGKEVVMTIPTGPLSKLVQPISATFSTSLSGIEYFGAVCVILELKKPVTDIYWLNIADEGYPFGGVITQTNIVSPSYYGDRHVMYLSRYFTLDEPLAKMGESELREHFISPLEKVFPEFDRDDILNTHVFRTNTAATVCGLNFSKQVPACRTEIAGLFLANMAHIYPDERSVNNSIRVAAETCKVMGIPSDFVPHGTSLSGRIGFE